MTDTVLTSALVLILAKAGTGPARPGPLEVIPADAVAAVGIRNLADLRAKGDKLFADADLKGLPRPSDLFTFVYNFLGIRGGIDLEGSAVILLAHPENAGEILGPANLESLLVGALPFTDQDKMAANFGFKAGEVQAGKALAIKAQKPFVKFVYVHGKHLLVGTDARTLERVAKAKSLHETLPSAHRKTLQDADVFLHVTPSALDKLWERAPNPLETQLTQGLEPADAKVVKNMLRALWQMRFAVVTVRIAHGLNFKLLAVFPEKGAKLARKLLADLGSGSGTSGLRGLPEGPVFAAQAFRGDGTKGAIIVRSLFDLLLKDFAETQQVLLAANRPVYAGILGEVWQHLKGSRAALYQTPDEQALGLFNLVAILDTDDGARFVADMRALAGIADDASLDKVAKEVVDLTKLVRDLGDPKYRVRELASLKLRLLGEPALAALKQGATSADVETARRASRLGDEMARAAAARRKELLAKELPRHLRPTFSFQRKQEVAADQPIDVVRIKLADRDVPAAKQLRALLGPQWDRMRLAVHGKQVVVLLGSEVSLLAKTLANLKGDEPGLVASKALAGFHKRASPARKIEVHVSLQRLLALMTPPGDNTRLPAEPGLGLTSFALAVGADNLQFDVYLPVEEIRVLARKSGW